MPFKKSILENTKHDRTCLRNPTRVEFGQKNNVRLAVNSGEKNLFLRKAPASSSVECGEFLRFLAVKIFFHLIHRISYKKETAVQGFEPLTSCISTTSFSTAPSVTHFYDIFCEYKISVVNNCKICGFSGEIFFHCVLLVPLKIFFTACCW